MTQKKKILFVCLGNICRSAMAEGILTDKIEAQGLEMSVDSAGTSDYHVGDAPDQRMQQKALEHHLNISQQKARQFVVEDFDNFDYIFAMDKSNLSNILKLSRNEADKNKVELFLNISHPHKNLSVPDPYYGGDEGFENVYQLLATACNDFIKMMENE